MKKTSLILSMGLLVLASCSNDELVNPVPAQGNNANNAIGFQQRIGNMSRADGLETVSYDFGVWAVKGTDQAGAFNSIGDANLVPGSGAENIIMNDYLVGYWAAPGTDRLGYVPNNNQNLHGTDTGYDWYYEGLGSSDGGYTWGAQTPTAFSAANSNNANQYLKYWDYSAANTYFYAYAPYSYNAALKVNTSKQPYMNFGEVTGGSTTIAADGKVTYNDGNCPDVMYGYARAPKATYPSTVTLTFNRLLSKIRLAFYETVPGYNVEIVGLNDAAKGIVLAPTVIDGTGYRAATTGEGYLSKINAQVTYTEPSDLTATLTYNGTPTKSHANIYFQTYNGTNDARTNGLAVAADKTTVSEMTLTDMITVVPNNGSNTNDGFTLNVTLKFTSIDTGEVFYVYGAQVYIPAAKVAWEPNKVYTYVFRISNKVNGTTDGTTDPEIGYGPDDSDALKPIIFEDVLVNDYTEVIVYQDDTTDPKTPFDL